jgi:uncharacterized membrane protein YkvI
MTYCGAVIGAGFATGREVVEFFTLHGRHGLWGVLLATLLFSWAGTAILDVTHQNQVYSYMDLLGHILRSKPLVFLADLLFLGTLLAGIGVMTAAGGTILAGFAGYRIGCGAFLALNLLILRSGSKGLVRANSWLVPGLVGAICVLCLLQLSVPTAGLLKLGPMPSAILYVAFNTAMAAVVLCTLKEHLTERVVIWGGLGGGLLIGLLLLLVYGATTGLASFPEIPMSLIAQRWLGRWDWVYKLVLFFSVLTSALASMHGLACRIALGRSYGIFLVLVAGLGFSVAQYGFATLVGFLYPLLGLCNLVLLSGLCYYSFTTKLTKKSR